MGEQEQKRDIVPYCYVTGKPVWSCNCSRCSSRRERTLQFTVEGTNYKEVQEVTLALIEKTKPQHIVRPPSPWASGSFYLIVFIVVIAALSVVGRILPIIALPIVFIAGIIALSVIGAFQMRQDSKLSEKNFLELMALSFKYLPWIRKRDTTQT